MEVLQRNVLVPISQLSLDPDNPNQMTDIQMDGMKASLRGFGFLQPVIINEENMIIDGEHRYLAWRELEHKKILVTKIKFDNEAEQRMLRQTMNKLRGKHDKQKDFNELDYIINSNIVDLDGAALLTGQTSDALQTFLDSMQQKENDVVDVVGHERGLPTKEKTYDFKCPSCDFEFNLEDMAKNK